VVRQKLAQDTASDHFAGAVLIAHNGKPVFAEAYGLADREHKIPNTLKTRFRIGSMNKVFTAVATLQLVQQGKLGLDDPVGKYLTDYPNKDIATKVTIRQLLRIPEVRATSSALNLTLIGSNCALTRIT